MMLDEADMPFTELFDDLGEHQGRGVVNVSDGRTVQDQPQQRFPMASQGHILPQPGSVGVVEVGAEAADHQSLLGPRAGPDGRGVPVPGRRFHQHAVPWVIGVAQVLDDRGDHGQHDAFLNPQDHDRGRR